MLELNKVMVVGRLTRDPEARQLPSGSTVVNFSIAVNRRRKDTRTNDYVDETSFFDVSAWERQAEFVQQYFSKGKAIFVEGRLEQRRWEQDGQKRSKVEIRADRVTFAETKAESEARGGGNYDGGQQQSYSAPAQPPASGGMPPMPGGAAPSGGASSGGGTDDDLPF